MSTHTPDSAEAVESRIKADVQRSAEDSNPYLLVHWLRSLIAGISRRIFDFYGDLKRTELDLMPDTSTGDSSDRWGKMLVGSKNAAEGASGKAIATGTAASIIPANTVLTAGSNEYKTVSEAQITAATIAITSITRTGTTATATTTTAHNLSSFVDVSITGATQTEYNYSGKVTVLSATTFSYEVDGTPATPATGTIQAAYTTATIDVESVTFGGSVNLNGDSQLKLSQTINGVDDTLYAGNGGVTGGVSEEDGDAYKSRYLEKLQNPVANFNAAKIKEQAKKVSGVTRVFVEEAGAEVGEADVQSITRNGNVATVTTNSDHGYTSGVAVTISGATQQEYNVTKQRIIVESPTIFHYVVIGTPTTPATGTITTSIIIPLGMTRTFFMRDNDENPIPSSSAVATVKAKVDEIRPANTASYDNEVLSPTGLSTDFVFTELVPNTATMRQAIKNDLEQFFDEQVSVGKDVDSKAYEAAIKNTVDLETGDTVTSFTLSEPTTDLTAQSGHIRVLGNVTI